MLWVMRLARATLPVAWLICSSCAHLQTTPDAKEGRIYDASELRLKAAVTRWFNTRGYTLQPTTDPHMLISSVKERGVGVIGGQDQLRDNDLGRAVQYLDQGDISKTMRTEESAQMETQMRDATREFHAELQDAPRRLADMQSNGFDGTNVLVAAKTPATKENQLGGSSHALSNERDVWKVEFVPLTPVRTMVRIYKEHSATWDSSADQSYMVGTNLQSTKSASGQVAVIVARDPMLESALAEHLDFTAAVEVLGEASPQHAAPADVEPPAPAAAQVESATPPEEVVAQGEAEASPTSPTGCGVDIGPMSLKPGSVVMLSDLLGTKEAVGSLQGVVCHALRSGLKVTVALSIPGEEQVRINAYLASDGSAEARAAMISGAFWKRVWQDGRSSEAMVRLIETMRRWRAHGQPVAVLASDVQFPGNPRNAYMSARLLEHRSQNPQRVMITFLGNVHSSLKPGNDWEPDSLPVGYRMLAAGVPVESYDVAFITGTQWTCRLSGLGQVRCGSYTVRPGPKQAEPRASLATKPFITRFPFRSREGFDGLLFVGRVTASRPAIAGAKDLGDEAKSLAEPHP
jgi:hypothetical protein